MKKFKWLFFSLTISLGLSLVCFGSRCTAQEVAFEQKREDGGRENLGENEAFADVRDGKEDDNCEWQKNVKCRLSDCEDGSEDVKKLQIFGIPNDVEVHCARVWPFGFKMTMNYCGTPDFNQSENCYEFNFTPDFTSVGLSKIVEKGGLEIKNSESCAENSEKKVSDEEICLGGGESFDRNKGINFDYVSVIVFTCKKTEDSASESAKQCFPELEFKVSNNGLKKPVIFDNFNDNMKNYNVSLVKNEEGKDCLKIKGLPKISEKEDSIGVNDFEYYFLDSKANEAVSVNDGKQESKEVWKRVVFEKSKKFCRSEDGSFYIPFEFPKENVKGFHLNFDFIDDLGFHFGFFENIELN